MENFEPKRDSIFNRRHLATQQSKLIALISLKSFSIDDEIYASTNFSFAIIINLVY